LNARKYIVSYRIQASILTIPYFTLYHTVMMAMQHLDTWYTVDDARAHSSRWRCSLHSTINSLTKPARINNLLAQALVASSPQ